MKHIITLLFCSLSLSMLAQTPIYIDRDSTDLGLVIVKTDDLRMGVVDYNGNFIIPLDSIKVRQWFPPNCNFFLSSRINSSERFKNTVYDSTGVILYSDVGISYVGLGTYYQTEDKSYQNYFVVEEKGKKNKVLFDKEKGQILSDSIWSIEYGGENSVLIAHHLVDESAPKKVVVYNVDGEKMFDVPPDVRLMHSGQAEFLIAINTNNRKKGMTFIENGLDSTSFEFDKLSRLRSGWFVYSNDERNSYGLLDNRGVITDIKNFQKLSNPNRGELNMFSERFGTLPVATGVRSGLEKGAWVGIDSLGNEYLFTEATTPETIAQAEKRKREARKSEERSYPHESLLEQKATFPKGEAEMLKFIAENLQYPEIAKENGIQGVVVLKFVIESDGRMSDIYIMRDIGNGCGQAAVQCFKKMPRWVPAVQDGKNVATQRKIPVRFALTN